MKKKYIFAALVLMMGLASCDNLLDLTPQSQISQTDYFKTESDLQLFSNTFTTICWTNPLLMTKAICMYSKRSPTRLSVETTAPCPHQAAAGRGLICAK